ncbi:hypothetical protein ACOSQ3_014821 [Xanthoceras sorbifolium]
MANPGRDHKGRGQLKGNLKKKEDAFTGLEKKLKDSNRRSPVSDGTRNTLPNNKSATVPQGSKEIASLKEKIKLLEKNITEIDMDTKLNCLSVPRKQVRAEFMTEEEKQRLEKKQGREVLMIQPCLEEAKEITLQKWNMSETILIV